MACLGRPYAVMTMTGRLAALMQRLGCVSTPWPTPARNACPKANRAAWGSYYDTRPVVGYAAAEQSTLLLAAIGRYCFTSVDMRLLSNRPQQISPSASTPPPASLSPGCSERAGSDAVMVRVLAADGSAPDAWSYRDLTGAALTLAAQLQEKAQALGRPARVGLLAENSPEWVAANLAACSRRRRDPRPHRLHRPAGRLPPAERRPVPHRRRGRSRPGPLAHQHPPAHPAGRLPRPFPSTCPPLPAHPAPPRPRRSPHTTRSSRSSTPPAPPPPPKASRSAGTAWTNSSPHCAPAPPEIFERYLSIVRLSLLIEQVAGLSHALPGRRFGVLPAAGHRPGRHRRRRRPRRSAHPAASGPPHRPGRAAHRCRQASSSPCATGGPAERHRAPPADLRTRRAGLHRLRRAPRPGDPPAPRRLRTDRPRGLRTERELLRGVLELPRRRPLRHRRPPLDHVHAELADDGELLIRSTFPVRRLHPRGPLQRRRRRPAACTPATSPRSTPTAICGSPDARRTSSSPRAAATSPNGSRPATANSASSARPPSSPTASTRSTACSSSTPASTPQPPAARSPTSAQRKLSGIERAAVVHLMSEDDPAYATCFTVTGRPRRDVVRAHVLDQPPTPAAAAAPETKEKA